MDNLPQRLADFLSSFQPHDPRTYDDLVTFYAEDMTFIDPIQRIEGRAAFRAMNERVFGRAAVVRFEEVAVIGAEPRFALTWTMVFRPRIGPEMRVAGVSEVHSREGRVVFHRDHWDLLGMVMSGFPHIEPIYKKILALVG